MLAEEIENVAVGNDDLEQVRCLLEILFPKRALDERIETRFFGRGPVQSRMWRRVHDIVYYARSRMAEGDLYFGVGLRTGGRGSASVRRLTALWADLDFKGEHTRETRDAQLASCPLPPSILVLSGGGYHAYWLLDQPATDLQAASNAMRGIEEWFGSDHVHDVARILRLPGTLNHKYDPPVPVQLVCVDKAKKYSLRTLHFAYPIRERSILLSDNSMGNFSVRTALEGVPEGSRDNTLFSLAASLHRARVPKEYAAALLKQAAENCTPPFPVEEALRKVQSVYAHNLLPNEGVAFNIPSLTNLEEVSVADLAGREMTEINYLPLLGQPGYFVDGWSHLVAGYPRSGKTELLAAACSEWAAAGRKVLYVTEESVDIWARRAASRKLHPENYQIVLGLGHGVESLFSRCFSGDEEIVVVDTLRNLLGLRDETDKSRLAEAINPWVAAARANNKTFILAHHTRKGGGQHGEGIAGGHGLLGMFDIAIEVLRDNSKATRRIIRAYARLITPPELLYGMEGDTFVSLGSPENITALGLSEDVLEVLRDSGVWMATRQILDALPNAKPGETLLRRTLVSLAEGGEIERIPPMEAGVVQGQVPYWHIGQGHATA